MALVRCETCGVKSPGHGKYVRNYITHVPPVGHPNSSIVCGRTNCTNPGLIWLEDDEAQAYKNGQRIFRLETGTTKVRAQ